MHCISGIIEWHAKKACQMEETSATIKTRKSLLADELEDIDGEYIFNDDYHEITNLKDNYKESKSFLKFLELGSLKDALMEIDEADNEDHENDEIQNVGNFSSKNDLILLPRAILKGQLPSRLKKPPIDWGAPSAGKLCFSDWITLSTFKIPFVVFEIKFHQKTFLDVFFHLVKLLEIEIDYETNEEKIQTYFFHLVTYHCLLEELYPELNPNPNQTLLFISHRVLEISD
ncbi:hypothetical protein O181_022845 [Austropuccinia psidii MF-1]|uniref:Uncharacterized protein n=1 Tax=Austropuccinia psidii MF-1 TaxID=1389203 RepID=A0A9Q3GYI2_9BASI|nr:hypothetical protein [Austropuccinia psidii MF-1]